MAHSWRGKVVIAIQLFFLTQTQHLISSAAEIPISICSNSSSTPLNRSLSNHRNTVFAALTENANLFKFYSTSSAGNDSGGPDAQGVLYGQFICLNYSLNNTCRNCVEKATKDIALNCPNTSEAIVWEEVCQVRISSTNFFGKFDPLQENQWQKNPTNILNPDRLSSYVNKTLNDLAEKLDVSPTNTNTFATSEVEIDLNTSRTLYSFVQCAQDLSREDCSACLVKAVADVRGCCYMSIGARVLSPSCYLRYELYPIYSNQTASPAGDDGSRANEWKSVFLPIMIASLVVALLGSSLAWFTVRRRKLSSSVPLKWGKEIHKDPERHMYPHLFFTRFIDSQSTETPTFDLQSILEATENFSDKLKLGQGGFGPVYKGVLRDGTEVAVKRLQEICSGQGLEEFQNEVLLIIKLQHSNLVRLLGFWAGGDERLLVYEYMPNCSLDVYLSDPRRRMRLSWSRRLDIITGVARGMLYLHEESRQKIIHRDLKASNILLDADMNPKISDFGIARIFAGTEGAANTTTVIGTYGYMAPEYAMEGIYSIKSDVYSFGVLLLEILTGKRNAGFSKSKLAPSLPVYAWRMSNEGRALELMDPLLHGFCPAEEFTRCIRIGLLCVQEDPLDRPTMSSVVVMLKRESISLHQPQRPAFSMCQYIDNSVNIERPEGGSAAVNSLTISNMMPR